MHILHVNDVAFVGSNLVAGLNQRGHTAELRRLQLAAAKRSTAAKLLAIPLRLAELAAVNRMVHRGNYDAIHIHFAYLGWLGITRWVSLSAPHPWQRCAPRSPRLAAALVDPAEHRTRQNCALFDARSGRDRPPPFAQTPFSYPTRWTPTASVRRRLRQIHPPRILIISDLSAVKAVDVAFAAVAQLRERFPEVEVIAIKHGKDRERYIGTPGINFIERVPHAEMVALIRSCDIILGQLGIGSMGVAELESLACGKPVVCLFQIRSPLSPTCTALFRQSTGTGGRSPGCIAG
jgi:glycosyltransferase involved in cell wall biosynthesis